MAPKKMVSKKENGNQKGEGDLRCDETSVSIVTAFSELESPNLVKVAPVDLYLIY